MATPSALKMNLGGELIEPGYLIRDDGSCHPSNPGSILGNLSDIIHVKLTDDSSRLNGCCNFDGLDGPNLICEFCNCYVATQADDCWMAAHVLFDPTATDLI